MLQVARHTIFFTFSVFFLFETALCQRTEFRVTNYDETTGLQSSVINVMLQDSRGYLWFGTADGLCRYDGYSFKTFRRVNGQSNSLPGNYVVELAEDHEGKIWIGLLKDGISCYDPSTGIFKNYNVSNIDNPAPLARSVGMLFIDKENNIWAGVWQKGIIKLDKTTGKFLHYNVIADTSTFYSKEFRAIYNSVYDMCEEGNGIYWLATHDGLYRFNANTKEIQPMRAKPIQKKGLRDDLFRSMVKDTNGLWLGSWAGGLSYYDLRTKQWSNYKFNYRYKNVATTNIVIDLKRKNENELWIATLDKGLGIFNKAAHKFYFFRDDSSMNSIPGKSCSSVMQDKQNNVWFSHEDGLSQIHQFEQRFPFVPVRLINQANAESFGVSSMLEDRAGKYLFTGTAFGDGLHVTDKLTNKTQSFSFDIMPNEESMLQVSDMIQDRKGIIWILTRDYIYQFDETKNKLILLPQPECYMNGTRSNYYTVIREDKKGRMWIATARNGIFCYDPSSKGYHHFYNDPANKHTLPSNVTPALSVDGRGRVWVGGSRGCFGYFDDVGNFISLDQYGKSSGNNFDTRILNLYTDKNGDIWSATEAGLYYYSAHEALPQLKKLYNADNGLRGDLSEYIQQDKDGYIWCVTPSALCRINNQTGSITTFGKLDGLDNISSVGGVYLFPDGKMSLFTYAGYYIFDPSKCEKKNTTAQLAVTSFKIDDKEQFFENKIAAGEKLIVPAHANVISFEFAALDFDRPDKLFYAYKLEDFDKNWVVSGQRRFAGYGNIPGGDYIFKVKATNTPDNWNVPVIAIPIHVEQPFYKAWWFILTVIAVIAFSLYEFYRYKIIKHRQILELETKAQILEKEKALVQYESLKQQLNPHFLFNSLTSLNSLIRYDQRKASDFLEGLSRTYRYVLKSKDHETVSLIEEIKFVQTFIKLQQTRFNQGLVVNIDIDKEFDQCKIPPVTLQNLIENAIKHNIIDDESPLMIDIYQEDGYIVTRNNLQRKNCVETSNRQGLSNLKTLYYYLSNKPVLITETETYFFVKVPLI
jgi:ligand-binding sensor domain-containing protein